MIEEEADRLSKMIDDLLDASRVTSGKIVLQCEDVELRALVKRCISALAPNLSHGTTLLRWRPDKPPAACRMEQLHQPARRERKR